MNDGVVSKSSCVRSATVITPELLIANDPKPTAPLAVFSAICGIEVRLAAFLVSCF